MSVRDRCDILTACIEDIQSTSSIVEKRMIIHDIPSSYMDDFKAIVEVLSGHYIFGFKMSSFEHEIFNLKFQSTMEFSTLREVFAWLKRPRMMGDLSHDNIIKYLLEVRDYWEFLQPIVDRELRLGINKSLLEVSNTAPMLANKMKSVAELRTWNKSDYWSVTEKLDGNRCISYYDGENDKWVFLSRSGKEMHVDFDMRGLPESLIYDGEVISPEQEELSKAIFDEITYGSTSAKPQYVSFNKTSGQINQHTINKQLVYKIFDIQMPDVPYNERRRILNELTPYADNVKIHPVLTTLNYTMNMEDEIARCMQVIRNLGGEGLMLNKSNQLYQHKRVKDLLKVKDVQTMDMLVLDIFHGNGKYENAVGGLVCQAITPDGKIVNCNVGTGLSDEQRFAWKDRKLIVGKIVEVEYFSLSQDSSALGTQYYSLRFPRLKGIRRDKTTTSTF